MSGRERVSLAPALAVLQVCPDWTAAELGDLTYLNGGFANRNYRLERAGRTYVLRLSAQPRARLDREIQLLQQLRASAPGSRSGGVRLRFPRLVAADPGAGILLTEYLPGQHLHEAATADDRIRSGRWLPDLHQALPPGPAVYDPFYLLPRRTDLPAWLRRIAERTMAAYPAPESKSVGAGPGGPATATASASANATWGPCHNDLNPWNLIVQDGPERCLAVLDFESVGRNHRGFDLVTLRLGLAREIDADLDRCESTLLTTLGSRTGAVLVAAYWLREFGFAVKQLPLRAGAPMATVDSDELTTALMVQRELALERLAFRAR